VAPPRAGDRRSSTALSISPKRAEELEVAVVVVEAQHLDSERRCWRHGVDAGDVGAVSSLPPRATSAAL
jgi:hypothetical protein